MSSPRQHPQVIVLDSGIGGLSVTAALKQRIPNLHVIYICDNAHIPYGTKTAAEVESAVVGAIDRAARLKDGSDAIVIACNTASVVVLPALRQRHTIPVVGVVPAIKPAARQSKSKIIGLLATPATVSGSYTKTLIDEFAKDCTVRVVGAAKLVAIAEAKLRGEPVDLAVIRAEIAPLFKDDSGVGGGSGRIDTVVLGCTHYPLLVDELAKAAPWPVAWIDSATAIAERLATVLSVAGKGAVEDGGVVAGNREISVADSWMDIYVTRLDEDVRRLEPCLQKMGFRKNIIEL